MEPVNTKANKETLMTQNTRTNRISAIERAESIMLEGSFYSGPKEENQNFGHLETMEKSDDGSSSFQTDSSFEDSDQESEDTEEIIEYYSEEEKEPEEEPIDESLPQNEK